LQATDTAFFVRLGYRTAKPDRRWSLQTANSSNRRLPSARPWSRSLLDGWFFPSQPRRLGCAIGACEPKAHSGKGYPDSSLPWRRPDVRRAPDSVGLLCAAARNTMCQELT
jgi:hypothetical protein